VPVALHRDHDGRVHVEPALWDPRSSQVVVWADSFSDRWGAWYDPRNWVEEVVQAGQGAFDFAADFVTGRTDPPPCRADPPGWSAVAAHEASSLHVCAQSNPAADGTARLEVLVKSNRRTAQLVQVPAVTKDYVWTENLPDTWRRLLTGLAGVDPGTNTVLLGTLSMSVGFRQPDRPVDFDMRAYQTPRIITANPVFALLGNLPVEATLGELAAVAKCHAEASGVDVTRLDAVPDDTRPGVAFAEGVVRCAFEVLQHPELAVGVAREVAGAVGVRDGALLAKVEANLRAVAPTAARLASALAVGSTLTNVWDGIFDNLADGRISVRLDGADRRAAAPSADTPIGRLRLLPRPSPGDCRALESFPFDQIRGLDTSEWDNRDYGVTVWGLDPATRSIDLDFSVTLGMYVIRDGALVANLRDGRRVDDAATRRHLYTWDALYLRRPDEPDHAPVPTLAVGGGAAGGGIRAASRPTVANCTYEPDLIDPNMGGM
jgi:hypothetical protein